MKTFIPKATEARSYVRDAATIFEVDDIQHVDVPVPEWTKPGQPTLYITLQSLTPDVLTKYGELIESIEGKRAANVLLVMQSAVKRNADGTATKELLFPREYTERLQNERASKVINRLARAALDLNGQTTAEDVEKAKNV